MNVIQRFQEVCASFDENNPKENKQLISTLLEEIHLNQKEQKNINENYDVFDKIFCLEQKKQTQTKTKLPIDQGNITVFIAKPYKIERGDQEKVEFFCLNKYNPATMDVGSLNPTKDVEETMQVTFPNARNYICIYPKGMKVKNKGKFIYKTYNDVIDTGKRIAGISNITNFKASKSSISNYNELIQIFNNDISSMRRCIKCVN